MKISRSRSGIHYSSSIFFEETCDESNIWYSISTHPDIYFLSGHFFLELIITKKISSYQNWSIRTYKRNISRRSTIWDSRCVPWFEFFDSLAEYEIRDVDLVYRKNIFGTSIIEVSWGPRNKIDRNKDEVFEGYLKTLVNGLLQFGPPWKSGSGSKS